MNYIVLDLEWNQGPHKRISSEEPTFEIIEIGAIKLNEQFQMVEKYQSLIKPQIYNTMHKFTAEIVNLDMTDLRLGRNFPEVAEEFFKWCGQEYLFCIWGVQDLTELQRNMDYYHMPPLSKGPLKYYDVQKLYSLAYEDGKSRSALSNVVEGEQLLEEKIEFHRALGDAYYTARIFQRVLIQKLHLLDRISFDTYRVPANKKEQVLWHFDNYVKLISEAYEEKHLMMSNKNITCIRCIYCEKALRKKISWYTPNNGKHYYTIAKCAEHGLMKGKIRIRKTKDDKYFCIKTVRTVEKEEAQKIISRNKKV